MVPSKGAIQSMKPLVFFNPLFCSKYGFLMKKIHVGKYVA